MTEQTEGAEVETLAGVGAWQNHDDPRDEWPGADEWTLDGIAGMLADAEDEFWTAYHRVRAGDTIGTEHEAMARRILTGPELAAVLAAAEVRGAQAVLAAVEAEASSRSAGRLDVLRAARAAAAVTTSSAKSSDLATRVPQDESQRAAGGGGEA